MARRRTRQAWRVLQMQGMPSLAGSQMVTPMQRPDPSSEYFDEFQRFQRKLSVRIKELRLEKGYKQEDMMGFEMSLRQYQRMEQDPESVVSLWQIYKLAKAFDIDISDLVNFR